MHRKTTFSCLFLIILFIAGCTRRGPVVSSEFAHYPSFTEEARFVDIPLPLQVSSRVLYQSDQAMSLIFAHAYPTEEFVPWYRQEAERLGWKELSMALGDIESLLIFEKPHKVLSISLRRNNQVVVTLSQKVRNFEIINSKG